VIEIKVQDRPDRLRQLRNSFSLRSIESDSFR
jgi:hypothetical protein